MKAQAKKKILFILHLPPPVHGVSVMNKIIYDSPLINQTFDCDFINLSTAGTIENLQKHALYKYPQTLLILLRVIFKLSTRRYNQVYITPFPYGFAFIKDSITLLLVRLYRVKPILHLHTYGFKKASQRSPRWERYYKYVFKNTNVICLSKLLIEDIEALYKGPVFILPNGIRQVNFKNTYATGRDPLNLLFLSNLIKGKGVLVLVDAAGLLKKRGVKFRLRIAGPENEVTYAGLQSLIDAKGLHDEVTLAGAKYNEEKYDEFRRADLFVLPSDYETFGLVLLEAMQFGVPCIATNVGGIPDVLGQGRGLLLKEISPEAIAAGIEQLIQNPAERQRMSRESFDYYETHFTENKFETAVMDILNRNAGAVNTVTL